MVKVGDNFIYNAFIGDKSISKMYYGNDCIWPSTSMTRFLLSDGTIKNAWPSGVLEQSDVPADVVSAYIGDLVTVIGTRSFINQNALSSVAVPDSVTSIGAWAFYSCSDLTSVTIPDSVTSIEWNAFENCSSLTNVTIPGSVRSIGSVAFGDCSRLTSVTISNGVMEIGHWAFVNCSRLTSVIIPDSVTSIGRNAFECCSGLSSVTIGTGVTSIGEYAFYKCSGLTSVTIPNSVTNIEEGAFSGCTSLLSVSLPDALQVINDNAFSTCTSCAVYDFGNTRQTVPQLKNAGVFEQCRSDMLILVPDSLYDTWIDATNWSDDSVKPHIVKWSDYYSLRFTAVDPGATIAFNKIGSPAEAEIMTSLDAKTWQPYEFGTTVMLPNAGDTVYFRAKDENDISFYADSSNRYQFQTSDTDKKIAAFGNIQSLMKADGSRLNISGKSNCYRQLFQGCNGLVTAPILPATVLADYCYTSMFRNCKSLTTAPTLPAEALADWCYASMFAGCKSLTTAPTLPAEALADSCYYQMFWDCTSLTGNTTVVLAQTSAIPNNALYKTFRNTAGQAQLTFTLDMSGFTAIPQLPSPDTMSAFDSASDARLTIKVPASLLTTWRDSSNWSNFADRIIAAT